MCPRVAATRAAARVAAIPGSGRAPAPPRSAPCWGWGGPRAGGGAVASSVGPGKAIVARWIRAEGPAAAPSLCAELGDQAMI